MRWLLRFAILAVLLAPNMGCGGSYMSEDAAQEADKEEANEYGPGDGGKREK